MGPPHQPAVSLLHIHPISTFELTERDGPIRIRLHGATQEPPGHPLGVPVVERLLRGHAVREYAGWGHNEAS
jgi:hypothetical protein